MRSRPLLTLSLLVACLPGTGAYAQADPPETRSLTARELSEESFVSTNQIAVRVPLFTRPEWLGAQLGLRLVYQYKSDPQWAVFETATASEARSLASQIERWRGFVAAPVHLIRIQRESFEPNDPYFVPVGGYPGQWHLRNNVNPLLDVNIDSAWGGDVTGQGVTIGIVDDSIEGSHPDLAPNFQPALSWDFFDQDSDPSPEGEDKHGISVSGVAAARGGNDLGVTGAAPFANLAGLRIGFGKTDSEARVADAVMYLSSGANKLIQVKNHSYGFTVPFLPDVLSLNALETSAMSGTIHCLSAGNSRGSTAQDTGKHMLRNSPWAIVVAATGSTGQWASYSSWGSNVTCTAPSSTASGLGITTTDRTGAAGNNGFLDDNYTSTFGGTSASSPLVAGCMALLKQVAPDADARVAKHLLARTCIKVDGSSIVNDGGWRTNAAGVHFNANYGFGLIDAGALVDLGKRMNVHFEPSAVSSGTISVGTVIPDNNTTVGITRSFVVTQPARVEDVEVELNISHTNRGHVAGYLTSPSGLKARFMIASGGDSGDDLNWRFLLNHFWGENAQGTWTIQMTDGAAGTVGTWNSYAIKVNCGELAGARKIEGHLDLQEWQGSKARAVELDVFEPGSVTPMVSVSAQVGSDGNFTVAPVLPDGTYDLAMKTGHWLRKRLNGLVFSDGNTISPKSWSLVNGDANEDNVVNVLDYSRLSDSYNLSVGEPGFDSNCDFNGDESVDLLDYFILSDSYNRVGD